MTPRRVKDWPVSPKERHHVRVIGVMATKDPDRVARVLREEIVRTQNRSFGWGILAGLMFASVIVGVTSIITR